MKSSVRGLVTARNNQFEIKSNNNAEVVERSAVAVVRSEAEQRVYESTLNPGWLEQWNGGADVGFSLTRGNSTTTNLALGMSISRETLRDKTSLYAASVYNRESTSGISRTVANTFRFAARLRSKHQRRLVWLWVNRSGTQRTSGFEPALGPRWWHRVSRDP